ncbi:MAG: lysophospholipid acyltransferase family protein [Acidobacteriota bacterium]
MPSDDMALASDRAAASQASLVRSLMTHTVMAAGVLILGPFAILLSPFSRGDMVLFLARIWSRSILWVAGVRLEIEGIEKMKRDEARVLVGNHTSNFDIYVMILALKDHRFRFTPKKELQWVPVLGWALWASRFPFIDRGRSQKSLQTMKRLAERIRRMGMSLVFFPEATRSTRNELLPFKKGPFVLAIDAGVPLVPFVIHGARRVQGRHAFSVRPGTIRVSFLEPIPTEGLGYEDRDDLLLRARRAILEELGEEKAKGIS